MEQPRASTDDTVAVALAALEKRLENLSGFATSENHALRELIEARLYASAIALDAAKEALDTRLSSGDEQLLIHIDAQKVSTAAALAALYKLLDERELSRKEMNEAQKESLKKSEDTMNSRLHAMNLIREQLRDQAGTFVTKEGQETLVSQIERNRQDIAEQRGQHLPIITFETALNEWSIWRTKVDVRDAETRKDNINRATLDDLLNPIMRSVESLKSFQFKIVGALVLATFILPSIIGAVVYLLTRQAIPVAK